MPRTFAVIDDGADGYSETGEWTVHQGVPGRSYSETYRSAPAGGPLATAVWEFVNPPVGSRGVRVLVSSVVGDGSSPRATYVLEGVAGGPVRVVVDQRRFLLDGGKNPHLWGVIYAGPLDASGILRVRLSTADADPGTVIADAVRVEAWDGMP